VAQSLNTLACLYDAQGRFDEAEPLYSRSLAIEQKVRGPEHPNIAALLDNLATLHHAQNHFVQAECYYRRALAVREKIGNVRDLAPTLYNLGVLYNDLRNAAAEPLLKRSLTLREKALGPDHLDVAASLEGLAALHARQGRSTSAEPLYQWAVVILEKALGADHPEVARCLTKLVGVYNARGEFAKAEPFCRRALAIARSPMAPNRPAWSRFWKITPRSCAT
jgi:tetratricopeptide (TPR) repeat protein